MDWGRYPLLVAGLVAIGVGVGLLVSTGAREFAGMVLVVLGACLLGAFIERR